MVERSHWVGRMEHVTDLWNRGGDLNLGSATHSLAVNFQFLTFNRGSLIPQKWCEGQVSYWVDNDMVKRICQILVLTSQSSFQVLI